jgi:hypothetical protein
MQTEYQNMLAHKQMGHQNGMTEMRKMLSWAIMEVGGNPFAAQFRDVANILDTESLAVRPKSSVGSHPGDVLYYCR